MAAVSLSVSTVKPLGDRVFVKVSESEEKTAGGILLPDSPGINDPCEKQSRDAFANLNSQQREDITAAAQQVLRLIAFRQVKHYF